ncbi:transcription-repair coupling factor, partial [Candidatus Liberibacter sp.]|uniref:transcription-repair coupling factor n=1 Tax=Candidatus Liberibacter sp. TaxID=34022 RepID=UPI0015F77D8E
MIFGSDVAEIGTTSCKKQIVSHVVSGTEGFLLAEMARSGSSLVYISSDERSLLNLKKILAFTVPEIKTFILPAWDCLPYDRVSPSPRVVASRLSCFSHLAARTKEKKVSIILTTVSALMYRFLNPDVIENYKLRIRSGDQISMTQVIERLETNGFQRVDIVHAVGEYAVRGGILDLYVPTKKHPIRLDFFGDNLESLRFFDSVSQRTIGNISSVVINVLSEVILTPQTISLFRENYLLNFGAVTQEDPLYVSVSAGRRYPGVEHWLPFFYNNLETVFTYFADFCVVTDSTVKDAVQKRSQWIQDYYEARSQHLSIKDNTSVYKPILPEKLYLDCQQFNAMLENSRNLVTITPFNQQETEKNNVISLNVRSGKSWIPSFSEKKELRDNAESIGRFDRLIAYIADQNRKGKQVLISAFSEGSLQYLLKLLAEDGLEKTKRINLLAEMDSLVKGEIATTVLSLDAGFETKKILLITEKDILGERIMRRSRRRKSAANAIFEATSIEEGTIVVHAEHGIGRFVHLRSLEVAGTLHDCLELHYDDDAKLFLPVENIDLISRYSAEDVSVLLDKLGGVSWQARKAQLKKRLEDLAQQLIDIAAKRSIHKVPSLIVPQDLYKKFVQRFPYVETEDQEKAIEAVLQDLSSGHPMDRLICGDVGFGKTEVVLRAAFVAAMNGLQVVVIAPTTLLVRQHLRVFSERFQDFALRIASISRFVRAKEVSLCKQELAEGKIDIIIGTHALLNPAIKFSNLGLLIIDEEQHFGVKHKEKLKEIKTDIHVLTLSATPIPRTLQLAMTGVRELSLITTPPIDRIPCRTSISIFDPLVVRETLMREHYRGGQSFYVCPRLLDLEKCYDFLRSEIPELKIVIAHGKMSSRDLEQTMNSFYDGQYDVLLSTSIVESGLDFPRA